MAIATHILLATTTGSLISLIGVFFLSVREVVLQQLTAHVVAFAAGGLIGGAFFPLLPEAVTISGTPAFAMPGLGTSSSSRLIRLSRCSTATPHTSTCMPSPT